MTTKKKITAVTAKKKDEMVKVALLGFGTVGSSVAKVLAEQKFPGIILTHVYNRGVARKRESVAAKYVPATAKWTENIDDVLKSDVDVVVELMGGLNPVEGWLRKALSSGKHVVTANKQLIAYRGVSLQKLATQHGVQLVYGAAVAGGVPVIPGILQGLSGDRVNRLSGIVNGTCNYILSRMETGAEYATVLKDAQQLGYAEANPSADVDGFDARAKLCILSRIALHAELNPDEVSTQTISTVEAIDFVYAKELNCTIRQVSRAQLDGAVVHARVAPMLVPLTSPMAWSHGTQNMVVTSGNYGGDVVFSGHGAGGEPTAVAVVSDLLAVSQGAKAVELPVRKRQVTGEFLAPHYLRFVVDDKPGIVSSIAGALAKVGANIDSLLQRPGYPKHRLPFVVTTEPCATGVIDKAISSIAKLDCMLERPLTLQMLVPDDKVE
ncbi:homoserine dehydrogenase [Edaphobacter sp. 12200R-103]|uniref:homoserine dehydrogenase n=1 Tax=Edaphobacter sp. 12200R-103 TaxID=2703788 RepID=UPI00138C0F06|nr:homoserine dehydrogenase [Edaphobacter sp. 12200R-103]QHS50318.1 homoserine dehydrogenase [Edaphobacter sp. 12200R-103]